ncbi:MAG: hypothetical protein EPO12_06700 [Aquabacterium sp.]|nr:MAG: hypothetical protein EPO12_06700 [Aquabacterium sp.]
MAEQDAITPTEQFEHVPFRWHRDEVEKVSLPGAVVMDFAGLARDVAYGVQTLLELLETNELRKSNMEAPLMNACDAGNLERLAITSLKVLGDSAEKLQTWAFKCHTPEGRAEEARDLALSCRKAQEKTRS